ncbi:L-idonate 5-dehydrogenase [Mesorhizobium sp. NZP2298]|uniref:L-idonate 5-dehydrogenase n=1 Tax=Mesorhizobium sp. NZP2298 TaxID=2483403 RepID=UPI001551F51F|nr:L-idonate 5-dehydrogenase [Mesorhizobium sp. NZP2298]QKC95545.1 L-idonate 5-dehydrogenase [Mesorhizobium sp. NZP2298]
MLGVVVHAPLDLRIEEITNTEPGPGEVQVRISTGGICGSDLHYFNHGGTDSIRLREPMILGHEIAGTIAAVGSGVSGITPGTRVAINPSRPCGDCENCRAGLRNHCINMRFMGSAMRFPHIQGGFREMLCVDRDQVFPVAEGVSLGEAAMAEPLAVCLHAVRRAGPLEGRKVLVTGCGPIGILTIMAARHAGAAGIVATDIHDSALALAQKLGADHILNVAEEPESLADLAGRNGAFHVHFEASGSASVQRGALPHLRPRGILVQLGLGGDVGLPLNLIVTREVDLRGSFRFDAEFEEAVAFINSRQIDVRPLLSAVFPLDRVLEAFALANDKSKATKVQISFGQDM